MSDAFYESYAVGSQVVASILFVVAMVYIWIRFIAPNVLKAVEKKNAELAEMEHRRDEAKRSLQESYAENATSERDIAEIGARADRDAATLAARIVADAEAERKRVLAVAEGELDRSRAAGREAIRAEIVAKAVAIARERAARIDAATDRRLVDETLDRPEARG